MDDPVTALATFIVVIVLLILGDLVAERLLR